MTTSELHVFCDDNIVPKYTDKFEKNINDSDSTEEERPSVRWAPLGATASPEPDFREYKNFQVNQCNKDQDEIIQKLEEEQEQLNSSLLLLTSHFAQIQLRLKQVVDDKSSNIEEKLKDLEEFAFKGVPDILSIRNNNSKEKIKFENEKQMKIIEDLKQKLEELESYAYQSGEVKEPPTSKVLARQKFIIEQLHSQLDINLENFITLSDNDLKKAVDNAINEIINPVKVREKLVDQLKTQILDLERFIEYLQDDNWSHEREISNVKNLNDCKNGSPKNAFNSQRSKKTQENASYLIRKALTLLQLIAASQFGCHIHEKKPPVINSSHLNSDVKNHSMHWGDIRAQLEVVIEKIIELSDRLSYQIKDSNHSSSEDLAFLDPEYDSDNERYDNYELRKQLLYIIRKEFSTKLIQLMQHGMRDKSHTSSLMSISCFSGRHLPDRKISNTISHPWDIIVYFYETKNGKEIVNSPVCKLSDSFDLNNIGGQSITNKQQLLRAIGIVIDSHSAYKRSKDVHFKAFVCLALNDKKLVDWLKIILKNKIITNSFYESWSYTIKMGFDDTLHSLKRLSKINFDLPFDISIRQLSKIKDAF